MSCIDASVSNLQADKADPPFLMKIIHGTTFCNQLLNHVYQNAEHF